MGPLAWKGSSFWLLLAPGNSMDALPGLASLGIEDGAPEARWGWHLAGEVNPGAGHPIYFHHPAAPCSPSLPLWEENTDFS